MEITKKAIFLEVIQMTIIYWFYSDFTNLFNCEINNLFYVLICSGCKEECIGQTQCLKRLNTYRQLSDNQY